MSALLLWFKVQYNSLSLSFLHFVHVIISSQIKLTGRFVFESRPECRCVGSSGEWQPHSLIIL